MLLNPILRFKFILLEGKGELVHSLHLNKCKNILTEQLRLVTFKMYCKNIIFILFKCLAKEYSLIIADRRFILSPNKF